MIIKNNSRKDGFQTIRYIREITNYFTNPNQGVSDSDSLTLSQSESDTLNLNVIKANKKKSYVSPYRQQSLSIQKIMKSKGKDHIKFGYFAKAIAQAPTKQKSKKKDQKINNSPSKYRYIPPLIQKLQKNETDRIKTEARLIFQKREKEAIRMNLKQKNEKWADFLLRQRRWEEEKQQKMMKERQILISRERQNLKSFTPRAGPNINVEEHIKSVKRKKMKLEQQLRDVSLNYFTPSNRSPLKTKQTELHSFHDRNLIEVQSKREISFLVNK